MKLPFPGCARGPAAVMPWVVAGCLLVPPVSAQDLDDLARECAAGREPLLPWCREMTVAFAANQAGLGLSVSGGSELPGSASTLGIRIRRTPRVTVNGRIGVVWLRAPDVLGEGGAPAPEESTTVTTVQGGVVLGVFDGFSAAPTLGGILALDLLGEVDFLFLPGSAGFGGNSLSWGIGARLGVLRESFTVPGITVSAGWRSVAEVGFGDPGSGSPVDGLEGPGGMEFDLEITSVRALLGKDLLGVGLLLGGGWDRYVSDVLLAVADPDGAMDPGVATADGIANTRWLLFGGASRTFLVAQVSVELGWADGFHGPPGRGSGGFDPGRGTVFGDLGFRITF